MEPQQVKKKLYSFAHRYKATLSDGRSAHWVSDAEVQDLFEAHDHIDNLEKALERMLSMWEMMMEKINHKASFYDADCIREMNEAPTQARHALDGKVNGTPSK